jgi:hypothetical protein
VYTNVCYESSLAESTDNLQEIIKKMRGSPSVEFPCKLCNINSFEESLIEKCHI